MDDVCNDVDNYNPTRNQKIVIVFDDMLADMNNNRKFQAIIKELFIRCRKLNIISLVSITQSKIFRAKKRKTKLTHYMIMKIT